MRALLLAFPGRCRGRSRPALVRHAPRWVLGSLAHTLNEETHGYQPLPDFPETAPDPSVRNVLPANMTATADMFGGIPPMQRGSSIGGSSTGRLSPGDRGFYSDEGSGSESGSSSGSSSSSEGSDSESDSDSESGSSSGSGSESSD